MRYNFKLIIMGFLALYIGVTIVFFNFYKSLAMKDTKEEALSTLNIILSIRNFMSEVQRPLLQEWEKKSETKINFDAHLLSASFMTQYIYDSRLLEKKLKYRYKLVASNPLNPIHKATEFEEKVLESFRKNKAKEHFSLMEEDDKTYFYIAVPINRNQPSCLQCHGDPEDAPTELVKTYGIKSGFYEKVGDLRAMISLRIATIDILKYHKQEFISGGIAMLIVFCIFIFFIYTFWKKDKALQERNETLFFHQNRLAVMGGMIGNISHQWKQPLTQLSYILINLALLHKKKKLTDEKLDQKINEAQGQITFMSDTINDFKDFFSPKDLQKKHQIEHIITQAQKLLNSQLASHCISLHVEIKDNFLFTGNANELVQVFVNIINNAKDAFEANKTQKEKTIIVQTMQHNQKNIITIENSAGNIQEEIIDTIFEPYFSTKDTKKFSGIGLYICKSIVEKFNGTITATNTKAGVIFTIEFDV